LSWKKLLKNDAGLGDTVERVTKATGIKTVVDKVSKATGKDCGCTARKESLNRRFNYDN
tara:strand:+ start:84 stop:260 length:177 start_codon:yes stop_codon:yes gene_type:complete